jgi:hypothetical protein
LCQFTHIRSVVLLQEPLEELGEEGQQHGFRNLEVGFKGGVRFVRDKTVKTSTNSQTDQNGLWKLVTMLTGRYFWKRPGEERIHRVESELHTVRGGQVNLVKTARFVPVLNGYG